MMIRRYWINTKGNLRLNVSLVEEKIPPEAVLFYGLKECSKFEYYLYKRTGINMIKVRDGYKKLRRNLRMWLLRK